MLPACAQLCYPAKVVDGDTFHAIGSLGETIKIRVAGFDAPERGQAYGRVATSALRDLITGGAQCECRKQDRYGRHVCAVRVAGRNVAALMLERGLGCVDERFVGEEMPADAAAIAAALRGAQARRVGMWSQGGDVMCPAEFRRSRR